jgi:aspartate 4-decarboxylase
MEEIFKEPCNEYYKIFNTKKDDSYKYRYLSPFEFKNILIELAKKKMKNIPILNAGRGNPNFFSTVPRSAFGLLNLYCSIIGGNETSLPTVGLMPPEKLCEKKLLSYLKVTKNTISGEFLWKSYHLMKLITGFSGDKLAHNIVISTIGCFYPSPPRIQPYVEPVLLKFLSKCIFKMNMSNFKVFTTEGATAAIVYTFNCLKYNQLVNPGDKIGILTPIFSPYIEFPNLKNYDLVQICIKADEDNDWNIPDSELKKIGNTDLKALFLCNPTNPTGKALPKKTVKKIANLIRKKNPNLIIIVDNVYAPFVEKFYSFLEEIPQNTISIYSFSKYFGVTGWRLGTVLMSNDNIIDKKLLRNKTHNRYLSRYSISSTKPQNIKFIDRMVLDSREVAEGHTAGLSTPQQVIMTLFAISELMDHKGIYNKNLKNILKKRITLLCKPLKHKIGLSPLDTNYYIVLNIVKIAQNLFNDENFAKYLQNKNDPLEFLVKLAKKYGTVCLPAVGFAGPFWGIRISIANLNTQAYPAIGQNIKLLLIDYFNKFKSKYN